MKLPVLIPTPWDDRAVEQAVDEAIASGRTKIKTSSMKLVEYNGFSRDQRLLGDRKIKIAIELGLIPKAKECPCGVCGTTDRSTGFDYHAEDYGHPLQAVAICKTCHLALHFRHRSPGWAANWDKRVKEHADGTKWFEFI